MIRPLRAAFLPALSAALALAAVVTLAGGARAADENIAAAPFWVKGATWASFRAGYVKSTASTAPNGNVGLGMSYSRLMSAHFSIGGTLDMNFLGKVGAASITEVPIGLEYVWHARWKSAGIHPYAGVGFVGVYQTVRRSGDDRTSFQPGGFFRTGLELPIDYQTLMGLDFKASSVSSDYVGDDPTFGPDPPSSGRMDLKFTYTRLW